MLAAIPAFNEARTIASVVLRTSKYVDRVIVVDDGSTDDTAWVAEQAGAEVIRHQRNYGYGAAIRTCLQTARTSEAQILVILDADGQHRPDAIPRVIEPISLGSADVVIGSRFLNQGSIQKVPRYRRFGIGLLTRLSNIGSGPDHKISDSQSGFRAYSRAAIESIDPRETDMGAGTEIIWEANRQGLRVEEVPIEVDYDLEGSTKGPVQHGLAVLGSMIRYVETEHALLAFGVPGLCLFIVGIALGVVSLDNFYATGQIPIVLAVVASLLVVLGLLIGFTGLILHAVINANRRRS